MKDYTLGRRIKHFRQMRGLSQLQLETEIQASPGSISRIENGQINPTKETLFKIVETLQLNSNQCAYLIGVISEPVNELEIEQVRKMMKVYMEEPQAFRYIIDDRWRIIDVSKDFLDVVNPFSTTEYFLDLVQEKTLMQFIVDPTLGVRNLVDEKELEKVIAEQLPIYYKEVGSYMVDDIYYLNTLKDIKKHEFASKLWNSLEKGENINEAAIEDYTIQFIVNNIKVPVRYTRITLHRINPRFELIEFNQVLQVTH